VTALYHRYYALQIGDKRFTSEAENPLHFSFRVQKSLKKDPNTLELNVYNLSPSHCRELASQKDVVLQLEIGYREERGVIFLGDVRTIHTMRDGVNRITTFESGEGEKATRFDRINRAFKAGTPLKKILLATAQAMGVEKGNLVKAVEKMESVSGSTTVQHNMVVSGNASHELTRLMRSAGLEWSVQNNTFQILEQGKTLDTEAFVLNNYSGLIGSPEPDSEGVIRFKSLARPGILPGRQIILDTDSITGIFRVEKALFYGTYTENEWYVECEAKSR